jgi:hypothetical protein
LQTPCLVHLNSVKSLNGIHSLIDSTPQIPFAMIVLNSGSVRVIDCLNLDNSLSIYDILLLGYTNFYSLILIYNLKYFVHCNNLMMEGEYGPWAGREDVYLAQLPSAAELEITRKPYT